MPALIEQAHALREGFRFLEASKLYDELVSADAFDSEFDRIVTRKWRANTWFVLGRVRAARREYETLIGDLRSNAEGMPPDRVRQELGNCQFNLAQTFLVTGVYDGARASFSDALDDFEEGTPEFEECLLALASLALRMNSSPGAAEQLLDRARTSIGGRAPTVAQRSKLLWAEAEFLGRGEKFGDALEACKESLALLEHPLTPADELQRADAESKTAAACLGLGQFARAEELLGIARRRYAALFELGGGYPIPALALRVDLAAVRLGRGDSAGALDSLKGAADQLENFEASLDLARCRDTEGSAAQSQGDLPTAAAHHQASLAIYAGLKFFSFEAAITETNLAIDHLLTRKIRYVASAIELFKDARATLKASGRGASELARCELNLGVAYAYLGNARRAARQFRRAAKRYRRADLWLDLSTANHNLGVVLSDPLETASDRDRERALTLLVTAALVRDSARHEFPDSDHRRTWWAHQAATSLAAALRLAVALDDSRLAAELIAASRLSGTLGIDSPTSSERSVRGLDVIVAPAGTGMATGLRLFVGPRVGMPYGVVALERYLEAVPKLYGRSVDSLRTEEVVELA